MQQPSRLFFVCLLIAMGCFGAGAWLHVTDAAPQLSNHLGHWLLLLAAAALAGRCLDSMLGLAVGVLAAFVFLPALVTSVAGVADALALALQALALAATGWLGALLPFPRLRS